MSIQIQTASTAGRMGARPAAVDFGRVAVGTTAGADAGAFRDDFDDATDLRLAPGLISTSSGPGPAFAATLGLHRGHHHPGHSAPDDHHLDDHDQYHNAHQDDDVRPH